MDGRLRGPARRYDCESQVEERESIEILLVAGPLRICLFICFFDEFELFLMVDVHRVVGESYSGYVPLGTNRQQ